MAAGLVIIALSDAGEEVIAFLNGDTVDHGKARRVADVFAKERKSAS